MKQNGRFLIHHPQKIFQVDRSKISIEEQYHSFSIAFHKNLTEETIVEGTKLEFYVQTNIFRLSLWISGFHIAWSLNFNLHETTISMDYLFIILN